MYRIRRSFCALAAVLFVLRAALAQQGAPEQAPPAGKAVELTKTEQDILDRTNAERKKANLAPYTVDPVLMKVARDHSANMARLNQLSHELEQKPFPRRLADSGYRFAAAGENIAAGQRTPEEAVASWMSSAGHKANLLNGQYSRIGIGIATSASNMPYYTQVFAAPTPPAK